MNPETAGRRSRTWLSALGLCVLGASVFPIVYLIRAERPPSRPAASEKSQRNSSGVSSLGIIEPEGGLVHVAAPYLFGRPPVVEALHVKEGERVHRGALLATLAGRGQLEAALAQAQAQTVVARRRLEQVKAGSKSSDLSAQRAEIARLDANLRNAQSEHQRYETLRRTDDVTASELDTRRTAALVAQRALEQATHRLESLNEIPETDIHLAEAQLQSALADEQRARRESELSAVHAPMDGQVFKVHAHPGEEIGAKGLLELGRIDRMYVVAEVYETDISRVRPGQRAAVSGDLLREPVAGTVERVGTSVKSASVLPGDPAAFSDNRIIEVRIRLDDGKAVAGLLGGKVSVVIQP